MPSARTCAASRRSAGARERRVAVALRGSGLPRSVEPSTAPDAEHARRDPVGRPETREEAKLSASFSVDAGASDARRVAREDDLARSRGRPRPRRSARGRRAGRRARARAGSAAAGSAARRAPAPADERDGEDDDGEQGAAIAGEDRVRTVQRWVLHVAKIVRAAHGGRGAAARMIWIDAAEAPSMTETQAAILEEIIALLAEPERGAASPSLARLEDTLTAGYARALELEAERLARSSGGWARSRRGSATPDARGCRRARRARRAALVGRRRRAPPPARALGVAPRARERSPRRPA